MTPRDNAQSNWYYIQQSEGISIIYEAQRQFHEAQREFPYILTPEGSLHCRMHSGNYESLADSL